MTDLTDHFFDCADERRVFASFAPAHFFLNNWDRDEVHMIVIHRLVKVIACRHIDLVRVHHGGNDIAFSELFTGISVRFRIEFFRVIIPAVFFKVHRVDVENHFVKKHSVGTQTLA